MAETIKDFLVSIGWDFSQEKHRRFVESMRLAEVQAKLLADGLESLARKAWDTVSGIAEAFDRLYFSSQRTGATVGTIRDFGYAVKQLGGSAEAAQASLEAMGQKLRENPGNIAYINKLGFGLNAITGHLEVQADLLAQFQHMPKAIQEQYRGLLGIDEGTLNALRSPELLRFAQEAQAFRKRIGFDPDQAAKDANEFMTTWRRVAMELGGIADDLLTKIMKALVGPFQEFQKFIEENGEQIGKDIDVIAKALGRMADGWVKSFEEILKDPAALKDFQKGMHDLAGDIAWLAQSFTGFIDDLKWLNAQGDRIAGVLNSLSTGHLPGGVGAGRSDPSSSGEYSDPSAPTTPMEQSAPGKAAGGITGWWKRNMPTWLGGSGDQTSDATPPAGGASAKARWLVGKMKQDFGLSDEQAAGAVGWMLGETAGTLSPTILGPGGDTGYAQWVGGRKQELLARGPLSDATNYAQIKYELTEGAYKNVLPRLRNARSMEEALHIWGEFYEGAGGTPGGMEGNYRSHLRWGRQVMAALAGGEMAVEPSANSRDFHGLNLKGPQAVAGGGSQLGLIDVARMLQSAYPGVSFSALNDEYHAAGGGSGPLGAHGQGRAFDATMSNIAAGKAILRARLAAAGFQEGAWGTGDGDFSIEPGNGGGTGSHLHFQWNNSGAAARYHGSLFKTGSGSASDRSWIPAWKGMGVRTPAGGLINPWGSTPPLGADGGDKHVSIHQTNTYHIDGAGDPHAAAQMVASNHQRSIGDITRNMIGATN